MAYRMWALRDFINVKKSVFCDFIESKSILHYKDDCWGKYRISGKCCIKGGCSFTYTIMVYNSIRVCSGSAIYDNAKIYCMLLVSSSARFYDNAEVCNYEDFRNGKEIRIDNRIVYITKRVNKNNAMGLCIKFITPLILSEIICVSAFYINKCNANILV
ncbi:hypothetical protein V4B17_04440 [Bartonella sp. B23]